MATGVQNISLTDYDSQMAEFARRQRMAQALQEQAAAPIEIQSYKGIQAPISSLSILSKVLQSYAGARGERKAIEGKGALDKLARELAAARGSSYMPTEEPAPAPTAVAPQVLAAALGAQPMDTQSGASRAAGIASNPLAVAAPPPAAPPPGMVPNTQSGASIAMGMGPNPNAAPMPMPPAAPSPAPAGAMAPINVPTPRPAGPSVAQLQAGLSKAISDADSDPNPYVRQNAARMIPVIQQSISRAQQQADTATSRSEQLADQAAAVRTRLQEIQATAEARGVRSQMVDPGGDADPFLVNLDTGAIMKTYTSAKQPAPRAMTTAEKASFFVPAWAAAYFDGKGNPHVLNIQRPRAATGYVPYAQSTVYSDDDVVADPSGGS